MSGERGAGQAAATRQRLLARLRAASWLALLLPALALVAVAGWLHQRAFAEARLELDRDVRIAQEHALKLFDTNQMLLQRMLDLVGSASDAELLAQSAQLHAQLQRMAEGLPQVQGLFINGADGHPLGNSRVAPLPRQIDYSDRDFFVAHRAGGVPVYVTEQLRSRSTGEPFFDMSRRRSFADGSFAGTVNVSLRPQYLTQFYAELARHRTGLHFALWRDDGKLVARWPESPAPGGALPGAPLLLQASASGAAAGSIEHAVWPRGGAARLLEFRRLDGYGLVLTVDMNRDGVVDAWRARVGLLLLIALPLMLGLALMARLALARTQAELAALARLDDQTALRQRAELALMQSQKLEALGRLTGGVAHDFNNLLMVVNNNLYLLRRQQPALADSAQLAAIERAVGSGSKLTRQLLAFARRQPLRPERIDLAERLPLLLELLHSLLGASIELRGEVAAGTAAIEVDPAELELALINLAVNAKDAMPRGGRLEVSARNALPGEAPGPGEHVVLDVADNGSGIDASVIDRVFDAFFTTKPVGQGTGLGLNQVQALAASAGGVARIAPRAGGGTCVRLVLRVAAAAAAAPTPADARAEPAPLRCRLLLVEDNDAVAAATAELLRTLGCTVHRVAGAAQALDLLEHEGEGSAFDVVLSDIEMPGRMDGIALAARLRARWPARPVLLMTGYAARLEQAVRAQFDVLPKPVAPAQLAAAIAQALRRRGAAAPSAG